MRRRIVKKHQYHRVPLQALLDEASLHSRPAAMDEPHHVQPGRVSIVQVLFHDRRDVAGREGMQVELAFDGTPKRVLILHSQDGACLS